MDAIACCHFDPCFPLKIFGDFPRTKIRSNVNSCDSSNIQKIFMFHTVISEIAWASEINENKSLNWRKKEGELRNKKYDEKFPPLHTFLHQVVFVKECPEQFLKKESSFHLRDQFTEQPQMTEQRSREL